MLKMVLIYYPNNVYIIEVFLLYDTEYVFQYFCIFKGTGEKFPYKSRKLPFSALFFVVAFLCCFGGFVGFGVFCLFMGIFLWLLCCNAITSDKGQQGCFSEMVKG